MRSESDENKKKLMTKVIRVLNLKVYILINYLRYNNLMIQSDSYHYIEKANLNLINVFSNGF